MGGGGIHRWRSARPARGRWTPADRQPSCVCVGGGRGGGGAYTDGGQLGRHAVGGHQLTVTHPVGGGGAYTDGGQLGRHAVGGHQLIVNHPVGGGGIHRWRSARPARGRWTPADRQPSWAGIYTDCQRCQFEGCQKYELQPFNVKGQTWINNGRVSLASAASFMFWSIFDFITQTLLVP